MEGISDEVLEVARNLFDGGDIDYNIDRYGKATVNTEELPDLDNYEYTYGTTRAEILQQAIDLIVKILPNVTFYNDYNDTGIYLELSDNHTFWDINEPEGFDGEFDYDLYNFFVEQAFDEFENKTGVEAYQCGRSGRHICVEVNFDNILNYDNLCKTQAELEQQVIGEAESNCFGQALEEAKELAPDEKVAKCLSCGMKIKYKNRDVQHDAMGDYLECPNCHSTFDVDYDNIASIINEGLSQKAKEELIQNAVIPEIVDILIDGSRHGKSLDDKKVDYVTSDRLLSANEFDKIVTTAKELISSNKQLTRSELYLKVASVLNSSKKTEAKSDAEIVNETSKYLADNGVYAEVDIVDGDIILNIPWGDWKHDHQRADYLMKQKGYVLEREEVTEEDGSDTYSAMRYYVPIGKGIKVEATDSADDIYNKLPNTLKNYLKNTDNVPTKEIDGTLWFNVTAEEKEQLENFVQAVDTIPESAWRNWDEKTKLDISSYANNANRICKNCVLVKEGKALKIEAEDYSVFKPAGKVLSGNKGLSEKEIDEIRRSLPNSFKDMTDEQKQIWEELSLRGMVMSCLIYGEDIHTSTNINAVSKYYKQPYVNEYYDTLGKDVTEEIIKQQTDYFNRGKVIKDVGTDSDGLSYNSFVEPKDESKKVTEAEDMTQVKDDIETAVEKSDSTDLEKEQVKGSLDVLKTDEESAIEGYEDFRDETEKVVDKELADAVNDQMEEIVDDEKEHIEKLDTIKSALGESKEAPRLTGDETYLAINSSGYKSIGLIVNNETKQFQIINGQVMTTDSKTKKMSKKQIRDKAQQLYDNGYTEYDGYGSVAQGVEKKTEAEEKLYLDGKLFDKLEKATELDFSNADIDILKLMYKRLDDLVVNIYDNRNVDDIETDIKNILSKANVLAVKLPIITTVNEAFNLAQVVRHIVGSKLEETFGYDFYYESRKVKKEDKQNITEDTASSEFNLYIKPEELADVNISSLLFDSDTVIADYKEGNYMLSLIVRGAVKIYDNETGYAYKNYQDFPVDLQSLIKSGALGSGDDTNKYTVDMNNWFEWFLDEVEGDAADTIWYDVADIEGMLNKSTPEENETELEVIMKDLFDDIVGQLNEGKKIESKKVKTESTDLFIKSASDNGATDEEISKLLNDLYQDESGAYRNIAGKYYIIKEFKKSRKYGLVTSYIEDVTNEYSENGEYYSIGTMNFGSAKHYNSKSEAEQDCEILKKIYPKLSYQIIGIDDLHITERVDFRPVKESKKVKTESAPADVIEYFGMQDNTDEEFKNNVTKEYKTLRAKYPDKEMILNGDFGTYLGTEKATPVEKGEYITVYESKEVKTEKMGKDADKKYSNLYKYKGKAFAYDNENAIVEYVYVDPEDNSWIVLDEIGLSNDNWDNKEARDEYLDEYIAQLDDEANRLADDFIANEYLGESLASRYVKTENKSIKTEASEGTATLDANSDLLPIINMYQYDLYNMCDDLVPPPNADMSKDVDEAMLDIAEPIIEEEIKGVLPSAQITFKEYKHPQYYRAFSNLNDVLYFDITYNVAEYEALKEKALQDPEFEKYLKDHYTSYDGFMSFFANNISEFNDQEDWKQFVSVLSYYLPNDDEQNYNTLLSDTYDKLLEMGYEPVDSIVDGLVDNITDRANDGEMTLNKDTVTQYIKELYGDVDQYDYILDEVLNGLSLSESKKVTEAEVATATKSAGEYWVGDPCYVVPDDIYQGIWGDKYKFKDGTIDCGNGLSFQVHGTAWGDGEYKGSNGFIYGVDAGVLAIVPMELATKERGLDKGTRHKSSTAKLEYKDGVFNMIFDNETITIDTDPSEDLDESKQLKKEDYEVRQDYYDPETGEATRNEYVMSFDTWEEAQRFADGLAQDPNCTAWVNDTSKDESKKIEDKELLTENDEIPVVNPDEQDYYNNKGYIISLYPRSRSIFSII